MISIFTALLAIVFAWFLLYEIIPVPLLVFLCAGFGVFFIYYSRHGRSQTLLIDAIAQKSYLKDMNTALKLCTALLLIIICVVSKNAFTGLFLAGIIFALAVFAGGIKIHDYVHIISLPVTFLLISGLALLVEVPGGSAGISVLDINVFGIWLCITTQSQARTALIISRALGAVSCMCFLSATTPMSDIIGALRKARCPDVIIDLMYFMYRYIFILTALHREMRDAAKSRLGFLDYRSSLRSTGMIYANLLARSYHHAGINFDAMESRCYESGVRFLEHKKNISAAQICASSVLLVIVLCLSLIPI